jgi:hypothetical protein
MLATFIGIPVKRCALAHQRLERKFLTEVCRMATEILGYQFCGYLQPRTQSKFKHCCNSDFAESSPRAIFHPLIGCVNF